MTRDTRAARTSVDERRKTDATDAMNAIAAAENASRSFANLRAIRPA
jgi:hypothetical protein